MIYRIIYICKETGFLVLFQKKKPLSFKRVVETFKNLIMEKPKMVVQGQSPTKSQSSTKSKSPTKSKGGYNSRKYTNITKKPKKEILTKKPKKEL